MRVGVRCAGVSRERNERTANRAWDGIMPRVSAVHGPGAAHSIRFSSRDGRVMRDRTHPGAAGLALLATATFLPVAGLRAQPNSPHETARNTHAHNGRPIMTTHASESLAAARHAAQQARNKRERGSKRWRGEVRRGEVRPAAHVSGFSSNWCREERCARLCSGWLYLSTFEK